MKKNVQYKYVHVDIVAGRFRVREDLQKAKPCGVLETSPGGAEAVIYAEKN